MEKETELKITRVVFVTFYNLVLIPYSLFVLLTNPSMLSFFIKEYTYRVEKLWDKFVEDVENEEDETE